MDMNLHVVHEAQTHRDFDDTASASRLARSARVAERTTFATAWYHDAAIETARRDAAEEVANPYSPVNLPQH